MRAAAGLTHSAFFSVGKGFSGEAFAGVFRRGWDWVLRTVVRQVHEEAVVWRFQRSLRRLLERVRPGTTVPLPWRPLFVTRKRNRARPISKSRAPQKDPRHLPAGRANPPRPISEFLRLLRRDRMLFSSGMSLCPSFPLPYIWERDIGTFHVPKWTKGHHGDTGTLAALIFYKPFPLRLFLPHFEPELHLEGLCGGDVRTMSFFTFRE